MLCYAFYIMFCVYVMLCYVMLCYVMLCHLISSHVLSCHAVPCRVVSCYVMLYDVMLYVVLCCVVLLCYVTLCYDSFIFFYFQMLVWNEEMLANVEAGEKVAVQLDSASKVYSVRVPFSERGQLVKEADVRTAADLAVQHRILIL